MDVDFGSLSTHRRFSEFSIKNLIQIVKRGQWFWSIIWNVVFGNQCGSSNDNIPLKKTKKKRKKNIHIQGPGGKESYCKKYFKIFISLFFVLFCFFWSLASYPPSKVQSVYTWRHRAHWRPKKCTLFECQGILHESANWGHYFYSSNCRKNEMAIDPLMSQ